MCSVDILDPDALESRYASQAHVLQGQRSFLSLSHVCGVDDVTRSESAETSPELVILSLLLLNL
jgi:hypothetical protein